MAPRHTRRSGGCADRGPATARPLHAGDDPQKSTIHPVPGHHPVERRARSSPTAASSGLFFQPGGDRVARYAKGATEPSQAAAFLVGPQNGLPFRVRIGIGTGVFAMLPTTGPAPVALLALGRHAVPDEPVTRTVRTA